MNYDIFNGDANRLFAMRDINIDRRMLVTVSAGLKRDNGLMKHIDRQSSYEIVL